MKAENTEFFEGARLALDSTITFGIKKVDEKRDSDGPGLSWDSFTLALTGFVTREVTGNLARDMLSDMMKAATVEQWNDWYRRILIKDLRCGVSEKTINKVVEKINPTYVVAVFSASEGDMKGKTVIGLTNGNVVVDESQIDVVGVLQGQL